MGGKAAGVVDLLQPDEITVQSSQNRLEIADVGAPGITEVGVLRPFVEWEVANVPRNDPQYIVGGGRRQIRVGDCGSGEAAAPQPPPQHEGQSADYQNRDNDRNDEGL